MPNSIRTPKPGTPRRIAEAVDNEEWQRFRVSLKGETTQIKLNMLYDYWAGSYHTLQQWTDEEKEHVDVRVDNYLKALARGGQIATTGDYMRALRRHELVVRK